MGAVFSVSGSRSRTMQETDGLYSLLRMNEHASWQLRHPLQRSGQIVSCPAIDTIRLPLALNEFKDVALGVVEIADHPAVAGRSNAINFDT